MNTVGIRAIIDVLLVGGGIAIAMVVILATAAIHIDKVVVVTGRVGRT